MRGFVTHKPDDAGPDDSSAKHLTKRELFAALMMQGMLTDTRLVETTEVRAIAAVQAADALLEELNKNK